MGNGTYLFFGEFSPLDANKAERVACVALKVPDVGLTILPDECPTLLLFSIPPLVPELTIVTFGGGVTPFAKPVESTFCVLCIMNDLVAPALPRVRTFFNITEELHALSIISLVVEMLSKSLELAVTTVLIFGVDVWSTGRTAVTLKVALEAGAERLFRLIMFRETMALCRMFPVGKDLELTLTYCGVPMMVALDVRVPKPMIVLAVPCDMTVLNVPDLVLIGIPRITCDVVPGMFCIVTVACGRW